MVGRDNPGDAPDNNASRSKTLNGASMATKLDELEQALRISGKETWSAADPNAMVFEHTP